MSATRKKREEFISLVAQHSGDTWKDGQRLQSISVFRFAAVLLRYAVTLHRLSEEQCNGYQDWRGNWDEKATERSERKEERIRAKVAEMCKEFGCTPHFGGDPRGAVLVITMPDGYTNDWERRGICVPA